MTFPFLRPIRPPGSKANGAAEYWQLIVDALSRGACRLGVSHVLFRVATGTVSQLACWVAWCDVVRYDSSWHVLRSRLDVSRPVPGCHLRRDAPSRLGSSCVLRSYGKGWSSELERRDTCWHVVLHRDARSRHGMSECSAVRGIGTACRMRGAAWFRPVVRGGLAMASVVVRAVWNRSASDSRLTCFGWSRFVKRWGLVRDGQSHAMTGSGWSSRETRSGLASAGLACRVYWSGLLRAVPGMGCRCGALAPRDGQSFEVCRVDAL